MPGTGVESDYTLINFPTTLRLPRHKMAFRLTHRFARPLGQGDFGDLLEDLFGLDGGAQIGLDFRFGLFDSTQIGIYRTSNRTIQLHGRQNILRQGTSPVGFEVALSVEGLDNFREEYSPSVALVLSRKIRERAVLYAVPSWVGNTNISEMEGDNDTLVLGLGGRLELTDGVAAVGEISPRVAGFRPEAQRWRHFRLPRHLRCRVRLRRPCFSDQFCERYRDHPGAGGSGTAGTGRLVHRVQSDPEVLDARSGVVATITSG